jgi:hypothetical protein
VAPAGRALPTTTARRLSQRRDRSRSQRRSARATATGAKQNKDNGAPFPPFRGGEWRGREALPLRAFQSRAPLTSIGLLEECLIGVVATEESSSCEAMQISSDHVCT